MSSIEEIADYFCKKLLQNGFVVQRYDAHSTNSIYLKLDYGVCNSIRISDHNGKNHLKYRYNIGPHILKYAEKRDGGYKRYFFMASKKGNLLKRILEDRQEKISKYGESTYKKYMEMNKSQKSGNAGFWRQSILLKMEDFIYAETKQV